MVPAESVEARGACANGHAAASTDDFCAECGLPVAKDVSGTPIAVGRWSRLSKRTRVVGVLGAVALVIGVAAAATHSSSDSTYAGSDAAETSAASVDAGPTPNQKCVTDAYAMAADVINNRDGGMQRELAVGGFDNPVWKIAQVGMQVFYSDIYQGGRLAAQNAETAKESELCGAAGDPNNDAFGGTPYTPPDNVDG